jgi:LysM repeat protein
MRHWFSAGGNRTIAAYAVAAACLSLALGAVAPASGAATHVVQPGESLWSIAASNNFTTRTVAAYNGLDENTLLLAGQTIQVPTVDEGAAALASAGITASPSTTALGGASHTVLPGESLSSVAAANAITIEALAAANGRAADSLLLIGETITIPAPSSASAAAYGLANVPSPYGDLPLDAAAATSWNAMREAALATYGVDLYPAGPLSAYRTYEQQTQLYQQYLDGTGAPANPPGTSTHELGIAVDVADPVMRDVIDQIGAAYGWLGNIPTEWWHVAYTG